MRASDDTSVIDGYGSRPAVWGPQLFHGEADGERGEMGSGQREGLLLLLAAIEKQHAGGFRASSSPPGAPVAATQLQGPKETD